jgi:D-3-phosphoglycerate dehydrogenase
VLDEHALAAALEAGRLAGAALDVFAEEPPPADHPLRRLDSVVLTPHLGAATTEAQQNVAIEIAEAVRVALVHGDLSRAVNAPAIGGDELRRLRPLLDLAEQLGRLGCVMASGPVTGVQLRYAGPLEEVTRSLASATLVGVLRDAVGEGAVNMVNAIRLAEARGIGVERMKLGAHGPYEEFVEVRLRSAGREMRVAGALVAGRHPRIVRIDRFRVVVRPRGTLVILRNRDVPGVIGRVGTLLGNAGVNIGEYHQARLQAGGDALAAISVDGTLPDQVVKDLEASPDVLEVRQVELG